MTDQQKPPAGGSSSGKTSSRKSSSGPSGTPRAGRRETQRRRYEEQSTLQRFRTPLIAIAVIAVVVGVSAFVFTSASAPVFACTSIDTVQQPREGELGQIQADMGNQHVNAGEKVTFPLCPPASGKHINKSGYGPLNPQVYGPDDSSVPNGWVHNLEHGGLVLLYSCDKGACDDASLAALKDFSAGFPPSTICQIPAGTVGPVVARFEQMPTKYAALLWNRVLYMDELDTAKVNEFFTRYGEIVKDGQWVTPPEPQCTPPSPSPEPSASAEASPSAAPSASASAAPSESAAPAASPSSEPSPSPSAS